MLPERRQYHPSFEKACIIRKMSFTDMSCFFMDYFHEIIRVVVKKKFSCVIFPYGWRHPMGQPVVVLPEPCMAKNVDF